MPFLYFIYTCYGERTNLVLKYSNNKWLFIMSIHVKDCMKMYKIDELVSITCTKKKKKYFLPS
jgi:hypothetical protein